MNSKRFVVGPDATIEDVDLDESTVNTSDGSRLTEGRAEQIAEEVLRRAGRPSLSEPGGRSPQITVRLSLALDASLRERAAREGKDQSKVVRDALEAYLGRSRSDGKVAKRASAAGTVHRSTKEIAVKKAAAKKAAAARKTVAKEGVAKNAAASSRRRAG